SKNVFRNADKRGKGSIVERVRKRVTGVDIEIFARVLVHLQSSAVIHGIPREIVAADQARRIARNAAVVILARRIARRWRPGRGTWIGSARNSLNRTKIAQCGPQQVMRGNKEITRADRETVTDVSIDFEARLLGIGNGTFAIRITVS